MYNSTRIEFSAAASLKKEKQLLNIPEPVFLNLLRSPGIDSQPGGIDSLYKPFFVVPVRQAI
jgi:hypothetical protein